MIPYGALEQRFESFKGEWNKEIDACVVEKHKICNSC